LGTIVGKNNTLNQIMGYVSLIFFLVLCTLFITDLFVKNFHHSLITLNQTLTFWKP